MVQYAFPLLGEYYHVMIAIQPDTELSSFEQSLFDAISSMQLSDLPSVVVQHSHSHAKQLCTLFAQFVYCNRCYDKHAMLKQLAAGNNINVHDLYGLVKVEPGEVVVRLESSNRSTLYSTYEHFKNDPKNKHLYFVFK